MITDDGYILQMAHVTTDENGEIGAAQGSKGPLLLVHDAYTDGTSYLEGYDKDEDNLVI